MAQSKFTLYKYIKLAHGSWRQCKAAFYSIRKIKPNRCVIGGKEEGYGGCGLCSEAPSGNWCGQKLG